MFREKIYKSYKNKTLGGYISINKNTDIDDKEEVEEDDEEEDENNDINFKFNMIFDSMGKIKNSKELFLFRLNEVKLYINTNTR